MNKSKNGSYIFPRFKDYSGLFHSVTSVESGEMSLKNKIGLASIKKYADISGLEYTKMIFMNQAHTNKIKVVNRDTGFIYKKVDSLMTNKKIILNAFSADCVPLIFYDPGSRTTGIAHSGWAGTYKNIVSTVIKSFTKNKIDPATIIVGIGPSIKSCCYSVDQDRYNKFKAKYPSIIDYIATIKDGKIYLDLVQLIKFQLLDLGVNKKNIEDSAICTRDSKDFYSYREQSDKENLKLFMTSIGMI